MRMKVEITNSQVGPVWEVRMKLEITDSQLSHVLEMKRMEGADHSQPGRSGIGR
jgi:hypothetical protein